MEVRSSRPCSLVSGVLKPSEQALVVLQVDVFTLSGLTIFLN